MESKSIVQALKVLKQQCSIKQTSLSYVQTLVNMYITDIGLFHYTCDAYDLLPEELMEILSCDSPSYITLYDELVTIALEHSKSNDIHMGL